MKLEELIDIFRKGRNFENFCKEHSLDMENSGIEIYMEYPLNLESNLAFFESKKTDGRIEYSSGNIDYCNLFDFGYFLGVIEELKEEANMNLTNEEVTNILYNYALNDG